MSLLQFNVIFEVDEDGYYVASVPAIPGCYTQGKTLEEAKRRIKEALKLCVGKDDDYSQTSPASFIGIDRITLNA